MSDPTKPRPASDDGNPGLTQLAPAGFYDPVIEVYKKDVDRSLLRENLKLTVQERFEKLERFMEHVSELHEAGRRARSG